MTRWIEIEPVDTLFFRGAESMVAGENHEVDTMFPPMPSTLTGAIRTAILSQNEIVPGDYLKKSEEWQQSTPILGTPEKPGFSIIGPLFSVSGTVLFPAPAHWMAAISNKCEENCKINVQAGQPFDDSLGIGLCGSVTRPFWVMNPALADMKQLTGYWVNREAFEAVNNGSGSLVLKKEPRNLQGSEPVIIALHDLVVREERVGIALNRNRTVREGHLYSTVHVRHKPGVVMIVGIESEHDPTIKSEGVLQLGGEQRICSYRMCNSPVLPSKKDGKLLYALSHLEVDMPKELQKAPRTSAGKLIRVGGWDMNKKFHKPLCAYLPAGTVISKQKSPDATLPGCITL